MAKSIGHLITMNDEYLYSAAHGEMYSPLRVNERAVKKIQDATAHNKPDATSCIGEIGGIWYNGKFMLATAFRATTKCTAALKNPSRLTKTEMCYKQLCNGNCSDTFMRNSVARFILPELYNSKQK